MKVSQNIVLIVLFCCTWSFGHGEESPDKTVPAEPLSVLPAPERTAPIQSVPAPIQPAPGQGPEDAFTGTTHETKNPDGSTLTVTHFKGQLPQSGFPGSHPHPAFGGWGYPGAWGFPAGNPYFNPWGPPQISPALGSSPQNFGKNPSKRDTKTNNEKGQIKESPTSTKQILNASSLPFSKRYPAPPRYSTRFHYPELPEVYWQHHKRPFVPLLDPELYGFNDVEGDIKQDL